MNESMNGVEFLKRAFIMKYAHPNLKISIQLDFHGNEARLERNETVGKKLDQFNNEHFSYAGIPEGREG